MSKKRHIFGALLAACVTAGGAGTAAAATWHYEGEVYTAIAWGDMIFRFSGTDADGDGVLASTEFTTTSAQSTPHCGPWPCAPDRIFAGSLSKVTILSALEALCEGQLFTTRDPGGLETLTEGFTAQTSWLNATEVAPVPLAAGGAYLLAGLGALGAARRRRTVRAA